MADLTLIGGGIVGIATALEMQRSFPSLPIRVLEKETALARHQTGRNSGVIHAGIYYAPGSLKARFCREGLTETVRFCQEHGLPYEQCGKLIVATDAVEMERLAALTHRALENGLDVRPVSAAELAEMEPNITGLGALLSPATEIVDYTAVTEKMAELFIAGGGEIRRGTEVAGIEEGPDQVRLHLSGGETVATAR
ncbi:FAD-dependent oxidoreductase, partial [Phaeovulum vinaykumarii]